MKKLILSVLMGFMAVTTLNNAAFADVAQSVEMRKALNKLNRIKPLQNPQFQRAKDILNHDVQDAHNKVVGEVEDVLLKGDGGVISVRVDFDRLRLNTPVYVGLDTFDVAEEAKYYQLNFKGEEIVDLYPELLANIESASGQTDLTSLEDALDRSVITSKGYRIGHVGDVLFDKSGTLAEAVYVLVSYKTIRKEGVAVPFSALKLEYQYNQPVYTIDQDMADLVIEMAEES